MSGRAETVTSPKPVIVVGAQRAASIKDTDGPRNLMNAIRVAISPEAVGKGAMIAILTITASSLLAYAVGRWIARDRVLEIIRERPKWHAIYQALVGKHFARTLLVVTLMRVPPLSPFALANFALAAARVPLGTYTLGTFLGILPRTIVTTFAAAQVEQLDLNNLGQSWVKMVGIALTIAACIGLGILANRVLREMTSTK